MGPNLLGLDGLAGRLGVLGVAAGDLGDGGHHNLGALNLTLDLGKLGLCFFLGQLHSRLTRQDCSVMVVSSTFWTG